VKRFTQRYNEDACHCNLAAGAAKRLRSSPWRSGFCECDLPSRDPAAQDEDSIIYVAASVAGLESAFDWLKDPENLYQTEGQFSPGLPLLQLL